MSPTPRAVVLAGGLGRRMMPLTDHRPKPLLLVGGQPLVTWQLERLAAAGVEDVCVATSFHAEDFEPTLGDGSAWGLRLHYSVESTPMGTGGGIREGLRALAHAGALDPSAPVVVINGDLLSSHHLSGQLESYAAARADIPGTLALLHVRPVPDSSQYGRVRCATPEGDEPPRVTEFVEKPAEGGPGLVNAGTYVLAPDVLQRLPEGTVSFERDVLPGLVAEGLVAIHLETAPFRDVGSPESLRQATLGMVAEGRVPAVADDARVAPDARVEDSWLGAGVTVGSGSRLTGCVLHPGASVGSGCELMNCVIAEDVTVADGTRCTAEVLV